MKINVPEFSLVVIIGPSGAGKSTFCRKHFMQTEIVSSDYCRGVVSNDENDQAANQDAFELLHFIVGIRLKNGLLTVVDATNVQASARQQLIELARSYHALPVAILLDVPIEICEARNKKREDRNFGDHVIRIQSRQLKRSLRGLKREGFNRIFRLRSAEEVDAVEVIVRDKLYNNKKEETGPFDIFGDVHGCYTELVELLQKLDYELQEVPISEAAPYGQKVIPPEGRKAIFLGDLVDRGPNSPAVLKLVMGMVKAGTAICVPGNHDMKLLKWLKGKQVKVNHGLDKTILQLASETDAFQEDLQRFLRSLISHYVLDGGRLVVSHAGLKEDMQGRGSGAVRQFCLYGETTGEVDEFGLPVRYNWAKEYRGTARVVYGHTPVPEAEWLNKTIDIDTGCVFGGKLTALRYPEEKLVSVSAKAVYCEPIKPLQTEVDAALSSQQEHDKLLHIEDVSGKRIIQTQLRNNITIREENSIAALEVMSRFAVNPKWLIYLPPTMSPCATSPLPEFLEHPEQAINYYKKRGVKQLICEEKHMGSRAIVVIGQSESAITERFGIKNSGFGKCFTRTGRNFFNDGKLELAFLEAVREGLTQARFWEQHQTSWVCLDCELMPWSAKAMALLKDQYAAVGAAASHALPEAVKVLAAAKKRELVGVEEVLELYKYRTTAVEKYRKAYREYCWEVESVKDYKLAPFHILATEGAVHSDKPHSWHMSQIEAIAGASDSIFMATPYLIIETDSAESIQKAIDWWLELTEKGGEGMVVKPMDFVAHGKEELLQPAIKCRGPEYLRIIYGPEYDHPKNRARLQKRGLGRKRSLALREFALGLEALTRFVQKAPLRRVHECVFAVLALESEEVDPRL